jgi:DNA-binding LacI/PurR family transcriptional regulator
MWKAVNELKRRGVLHVLARGGAVVVRPVDSIAKVPPTTQAAGTQTSPERPRKCWARLQQQLLQDIRSGRWMPGELLPSAKELAAQHGVSHRTVASALRALVGDGQVSAFQRGYRVGERRARTLSTIIYIGTSRFTDVMSDLAPRSQEFWRSLEGGCRRRNLALVAMSAEEFLERQRRSRRRPSTQPVVGHILRNLDEPREVLVQTVAALDAVTGPVCVVDELGIAPELPRPKRPGRRRVFSIANSTAAGRAVGRFLRDNGHRRVAFLSPYHEVGWAVNRLGGLRDGLGEGVVAGVLDKYPDDWSIRRAILSATPYRRLAREVERFSRACGIAQSLEQPFHLDPAFTYVLERYLAQEMRPVFRRVVRDEEVTAWVGVNDATALAALAFLRERGGARVKVVGFDNTFEALAAGMTSYDFNVPALVQALLEHIVTFGSRRGREGRDLEIEGSVVERGSVGRSED